MGVNKERSMLVEYASFAVWFFGFQMLQIGPK